MIGVEVEHHEDSTPALKTPVVHTLDDIDRLRVPNPATGVHILELDHKVDLGKPASASAPASASGATSTPSNTSGAARLRTGRRRPAPGGV